MSDPVADLAAALASRYRIERPLGAGGMATVYLAEDLRHHRRVAIKVLRPELSEAVGAERFSREITTTANLRHPNILPLFDSGHVVIDQRIEGRGQRVEGDSPTLHPPSSFLYYVMPYVEGETLRDRMERDHQMPVDEVLRIVDEVADALHYAHTRGVIHRDIKPENILLENGHAVVADFGIAHAVGGNASERMTQVGTSIGTPLYMSPEQAAGDAVDGRSDLYALGCVTWEMLTGAPPFTASNPMAVMVKHAVEPVPSLAAARSDLSEVVVHAVQRALAKAPDDRFASLQEWRAAVAPGVAFTPGGTPTPTAVLDVPAPTFSTQLLGREEALEGAASLLAGGTRLLSVTGYGGTGKTRFASELQRRVAPSYPGGTAFVSLAAVTDPAEVMPTIATTLGITEAHGRTPVDAIATLVGNRQALLVLDNLEQVVEAADEIGALIGRCSALQVVATSRRPLRIGVESEMPLPPLDLPDAHASLTAMLACPSVALFVQRAERVKPGFALTPDNAAAIAGICRALDGLPLALELAAARVRILEPAVLLQRLDHALDLLTSGDRDLPLRQRTLRATISWSYSLLTPDEQRLLRRLSVFHEGWTLEALEQVCFDDTDRWRALDDLSSLVEKGLVRVSATGERYGLLETIRAFAAEQLHAGDEVEAVRVRHAAHYLALAEWVDAGIQGTTQREAMQRGKAENANCFAAIAFLLARARAGDAAALEQGMLLCGSLGWYWHIVGLHLASRPAVDELLRLAADASPSRGRAVAYFTRGMIEASTNGFDLAVGSFDAMAADAIAIGDEAVAAFGRTGAAWSLLGLGRFEEAGPRAEEALRYGSRSGNAFQHAIALTVQGIHRFVTGDLEAGIALEEAARRIQTRIGDGEGGGIALSYLAQMQFVKGDIARAVELYREAEVDFATVGDKPELARVQGEQGYLALAAGNLDAARRHFIRAIRSNDEIGSPRGIGQALLGLAATEAAAGEQARAVRIAAAAEALSRASGVVVVHPMAPDLTQKIEALRASIPQDHLTALMSQGEVLTPAAVIELFAA